jgi:hypothetical protein
MRAFASKVVTPAQAGVQTGTVALEAAGIEEMNPGWNDLFESLHQVLHPGLRRDDDKVWHRE